MSEPLPRRTPNFKLQGNSIRLFDEIKADVLTILICCVSKKPFTTKGAAPSADALGGGTKMSDLDKYIVLLIIHRDNC